MKTAFAFLSALAAGLAVSLPVQAATIGGIEIAGIAQAGEEGYAHYEGALEHYYDNYLTSGRVVNAFGVIPWMGRPFLSGLPIPFNQAGPANCESEPIRIPRYDHPTSRNLRQSYGRFWFYQDLPNQFGPDYGGSGSCRQGLTVAVGEYLFTAPALLHGYDNGLGQIIFAGAGTLFDGQTTRPASIFLSTEFDDFTAPYQMLIRVIDPSLADAAPPLPPAPVPLPPAGPLALLGFGLLAGAGWRRPGRA